MDLKIQPKILPIFLISLIFILSINLIGGGSFDENDNRSIGYEFLDSEGNIVSPAEGEVVHIWNNATIGDYYFEKDSGIQLTNHYEDYWSKNVFCLGYYSGETWNKIYCADELSNFNRNIETDNLTYVNATLWKDISYGNYDLRLGIRYHLGLNDKNLSITIYGKNLGIDIPYDLGFAWKIKDISIPLYTDQDSIRINNTKYNLNETIDKLFKNMTKIYTKYNYTYNDEGIVIDTILEENWTVIEPLPFLEFSSHFTRPENISLTDPYPSSNFLRIDWNENLNYAVKMYGNGNQENFYVALLINAGQFNSGQEKQTTFQWIDAVNTGNLVAYYKLDDDATDETGDHDGAEQGSVSYTTGILNNAFAKGDGDYISIADHGDFDFDGAFSISAWFRSTTSPQQNPIVTKGGSADAVNWELDYNNAEGCIFRYHDGSWQFILRSYTGGLADGSWQHVVVTRDDSNNWVLYENGISEDTGSNSGDFTGTHAIHFSVDGAGNYANRADVDEVGIWKGHALTQAEVTELYNSGDGLSYDDFVAADCWTETPGKIIIPPGCKYYTNVLEGIAPS